jgi:small conductance mechanosensitive channel
MNIHDFLISILNIPSDSYQMELLNLAVQFLIAFLWIVFAIVFIKVFSKIIDKLLRVNNKGAKALTISKLSKNIVKYIVWFIVVMVLLSNFGVDLTPFLASAGVVGLAVGFGAQELVRDFISGFFIIFDGDFQVGDVIEVDDFMGAVLSIGLRNTVIENWKGQQKIINNGSIQSIVNYSRANSVAIIDFGVAYDTDLQKLNEMMTEFLEMIFRKYEKIVEEPKFLGVVELSDSSINMRLIAKTKTLEHYQIERDIRSDLVEFLTQKGIEIPFPQVVIHNA